MQDSSQLLKQIKSELTKQFGSLSPMTPVYTAGALIVLGLPFVYLAMLNWPGIGTAVWILIGSFWVIYCVVLNTFYAYFIKRYRKHLLDRLRKSSLIETIALGGEQLPDIYRWTWFPWTLLLGPRPATFKDWIKLVAQNLDWYLNEPRPLIRWHLLQPLALLAVFMIAHNLTSSAVFFGKPPVIEFGSILVVG